MAKLQQLVAPTRHAQLDNLENGPLPKHGALAVALGLRFEALTDVGNINQPALEQVVVDYQVPGRAGREEPLAVVARHDPVARRLVGVALQHLGVKVGRVVGHGARRHGWAVYPGRPPDRRRHRRCRPQNLHLRGCLLQGTLQLFVFRNRRLPCSLHFLQAVFNVLEVAVLSLAEGSLAGPMLATAMYHGNVTRGAGVRGETSLVECGRAEKQLTQHTLHGFGPCAWIGPASTHPRPSLSLAYGSGRLSRPWGARADLR